MCHALCRPILIFTQCSIQNAKACQRRPSNAPSAQFFAPSIVVRNATEGLQTAEVCFSGVRHARELYVKTVCPRVILTRLAIPYQSCEYPVHIEGDKLTTPFCAALSETLGRPRRRTSFVATAATRNSNKNQKFGLNGRRSFAKHKRSWQTYNFSPDCM